MENATPESADMFLQKIVQLENQQQHLNQSFSELMRLRDLGRKSVSVDPQLQGFYSCEASVPLKRALRESRGGHDGATTSSDGGTGRPTPQLNFSDKLYSSILESMGQAVYVWDTDVRLIYWNRRAEENLGYSSDEALGRNAVVLIVEPHDHAVTYVIVDRVLSGETWSGQFSLLHKNKKLIQVNITSSPLYGDDGSVVAVVCVSGDLNSYTDSPFWVPRKLEQVPAFFNQG